MKFDMKLVKNNPVTFDEIWNTAIFESVITAKVAEEIGVTWISRFDSKRRWDSMVDELKEHGLI